MRSDPRIAFWRATRRLSGWLLLVWLGVTLLVPMYARDLQGLALFGFPFGYWSSAAGALLVYLGIVAVYSVAMDRLEGQLQDAEPPASSGSDPVPSDPA